MMRTIVKSNKSSLTLQLPDDLIGKTIEVIAYPVESTPVIDTRSQLDKVTALKNKLSNFTFNSGGYKFNRDDANDYE